MIRRISEFLAALRRRRMLPVVEELSVITAVEMADAQATRELLQRDDSRLSAKEEAVIRLAAAHKPIWKNPSLRRWH